MKSLVFFTLALLLALTGAVLSIVRLCTYPDHTITGLGPTFSALGALLLVLAVRSRKDPRS